MLRSNTPSAWPKPAFEPSADSVGDSYHHTLAESISVHLPQTYLADILERIVSGRTKVNALHELLPWNWKAARAAQDVKVAA
jgi:hypothetical protein